MVHQEVAVDYPGASAGPPDASTRSKCCAALGCHPLFRTPRCSLLSSFRNPSNPSLPLPFAAEIAGRAKEAAARAQGEYREPSAQLPHGAALTWATCGA